MFTASKGGFDTIEFRSPTDWRDLNYITINGFGIYDLYRHGFRRYGKKAAQREARKEEKRKTWMYGGSLPHAPWQSAAGLGWHFHDFVQERQGDGPVEVNVFICSCDQAGCWNYSALVLLGEREVRWTFPDHLGTFTFDRRQYLAALERGGAHA